MIFRIVRFILSIFLFCFYPYTCNAFGEFSLKKEAELGKKFKKIIRSHLPLIQDPEINSYVRQMVFKLAKSAPYYPFKIEVDVVQNNAMNAFATLAGYMVVYSGMVEKVDSDSELAGVLAHELAHLTQRHVAKNIERSQLVSVGSILTLLAGILVGGNTQAGQAMMIGSIAGAQSALLKYTRENEREADQVGLNYVVKAGYDPWGMVEVFKKIRKQRWLRGGTLPSYLLTHPAVEERIGYLEDRLRRLRVKPELKKSVELQLVQTLLRSKYNSPKVALHYFKGNSCYDLLGKGIVYARLNALEKAKKYFILLNDIPDCKKNAVFYREIGKFYYQYGELNKALLNLQKSFLLNSKDSLTLFYYARALAEEGLIKEAEKYFQECLVKMFYNANVHEIVGIFYGKHNKIFKAHLHLAYAYLLQHKIKKFKFHLKKVKLLARTNSQKRELEKLQKEYKELTNNY
ncbi:beta-barrel assembly-enhancing protease [Desulfonauticus submarinus]